LEVLKSVVDFKILRKTKDTIDNEVDENKNKFNMYQPLYCMKMREKYAKGARGKKEHPCCR
jgi:hypothetical protein